MRDFHELKVWRKSHLLAVELYKVTRSNPKHELFGLAGQVRRSAASVPANIAEGCGRGTEPDLARFLHVAMGSASELEYHLLLSRDVGYLTAEEHSRLDEATSEVRRMLTALIRKLGASRGTVAPTDQRAAHSPLTTDS